ncbi:hypothetical protein [Sideroxydans sp. CL21]|nr:hypothetical protein [Sideroxydans sp. CL21]
MNSELENDLIKQNLIWPGHDSIYTLFSTRNNA